MPLFGGAEGQEVLGALHGLLEAFQQELEIFASLDEVDVRSIDHQQVRRGVAEKEMFVGAGHFLDVFRGDVRLVAGGLFRDARAQDFRLGLKINDQVGRGNVGGESRVIAFVKLQFFVVEIEVSEDAILLHQVVGEDGAGSFDSQSFTQPFLPFDKEVHLGAESGAGLFRVKIGKKRVVFAVVSAAGMELFGKDLGEGGFADAQWAFDHDETWRLRASLRSASALSCGGFVSRHFWSGRLMAGANFRDYSRVIPSAKRRSGRCGTKNVEVKRKASALRFPGEVHWTAGQGQEYKNIFTFMA